MTRPHVFFGAAALLLIAGCSARPSLNPAAAQAQTSAQHGAQAFARKDYTAAERDYTRALRIAESLGDSPARARALLSLSRIASQTGRPDEAAAAVTQVLGDAAALPADILITAHGRAAALSLSQNRLVQTDEQLAAAQTLCKATCSDSAALVLLRARTALARQQWGPALELADSALASPALASVSPPHRQPQASAERANALRVKAQAAVGLGGWSDAAASASTALDLDRSLGLSDRVVLDLQLLAHVHTALGDAAQASHFGLLAQRAQLANKALRGDAQAD